MEFNDLIPEYDGYTLVGWHCSRCGRKFEKEARLADIDALAVARGEFLSHTCSAAAFMNA
jgi:hypothetical protein